ncbi:MAG TPA: GNAT family N-acetyltransferase [Gaiellaceae bacterium]|nr:GNAT family N-acetyltransferase [Gaiellaceae bacterium]
MHAVSRLAIARAENDRDLEDMIEVRRAASPERTPPRIENLRHSMGRALNTFLIAREGQRPVGCGFVWTDLPVAHAEAHLVVVPDARGRGIGSALLAELGALARADGKAELEGEAREDDKASRAFLERRGYRVVGGEKWLSLDLEAADERSPTLPPGISIVTRAERPDLTDALFAVAQEGVADIPGSPGPGTYEQFLSIEIERPTRRPDLFFIALAGDEAIGYATLDDFGRDAHNGLTAVRRAWRRRGVARALKRTQIAAAKHAGFRRLVTGSEERNVAMRSLNAKLGYRPEPGLNTVVFRGPADVRSRRGHDG